MVPVKWSCVVQSCVFHSRVFSVYRIQLTRRADDATVCTECTTQLCVAAGNDPVESPPSRDILPVPIPSPFYHTTATLYSTLGSDSLTTYNSPETASSLRADFNTADDNDASIPYNTRCYVNARSKTDMSQLKLPHGNDN